MKVFTLQSGLAVLLQYRGLLKSLVVRDVHTKYRETIFGYWWLVVYPIMMLATYSFIFGGIFKSRWLNQGGIADFVAMLYCGLILYGLFSDALNRATSVIRSQPNFVKKVVFPLEILPQVVVGSALFNALIGIVLLFMLLLATRHTIPLSALTLPFVIIPFLLLVVGLAWAFSAMGVFFPDISQLVNVMTSILLFLSPVFFPLASAPALVQPFLMLNPLTFPIEEMRSILLLGLYPDWSGLALYSSVSIMVASAGFWVFQKSRAAFADVI